MITLSDNMNKWADYLDSDSNSPLNDEDFDDSGFASFSMDSIDQDNGGNSNPAINPLAGLSDDEEDVMDWNASSGIGLDTDGTHNAPMDGNGAAYNDGLANSVDDDDDDALNFGMADPNDNVSGDAEDNSLIDFNDEVSTGDADGATVPVQRNQTDYVAQHANPAQQSQQPVQSTATGGPVHQEAKTVLDYDDLTSIPEDEPEPVRQQPPQAPAATKPAIPVPDIPSVSPVTHPVQAQHPVPQQSVQAPVSSQYPSSTVSSRASGGFMSKMPPELSVDSIAKIIAVVDEYRGFTTEDQGIVYGFLDWWVNGDNANNRVEQDNEASIVKAVIELDADVRDGVVNLITTSNKSGADRAFYLMELSAHQLENTNAIMMMMDMGIQDLSVQDTLASIRDTSMKLNQLISQKFDNSQRNYIRPVYSLIEKVQEIIGR